MIPFLKMHGLGNDFVVLDNRKGQIPALDWKKIADRHFGIGCDQVVVLERPSQSLPHKGEEISEGADVFMRIFNADGGEVASCGNASRCVAWLMGRKQVAIETLAGVIHAQVQDEKHITVDMGPPRFGWKDMPFLEERDALRLRLGIEMLNNPVAVSMGNPHMVFFVTSVDAVPLERLGHSLSRHTLFTEGANVNVAQIEAKDAIRLRVFERGSGLTLACGTGACATLVAAHLRGLTGRKANVTLPGGTLLIEWRDNDHVLMTGPVATSFEGKIDELSYTRRNSKVGMGI